MKTLIIATIIAILILFIYMKNFGDRDPSTFELCVWTTLLTWGLIGFIRTILIWVFHYV